LKALKILEKMFVFLTLSVVAEEGAPWSTMVVAVTVVPLNDP
jgi:hypothetical protein